MKGVIGWLPKEAGRTALPSYQMHLSRHYSHRAARLLPEDDARCFEAFEALEAICRVQGLRRERKRPLVAHRSLARNSGRARWVYVSLHFYTMTVEAISRVDIGEKHTGILLATTMLGAMET